VLRALRRSLVAVPAAYGEALALIGAGGNEQERWLEQPAGLPSQRLVIFLEVLAITLTPFTIVLGLSRADGRSIYRIHQLRPRPLHKPSPDDRGSSAGHQPAAAAPAEAPALGSHGSDDPACPPLRRLGHQEPSTRMQED